MAVLLFLVIFLLFAIKKEYIGILVGLVIMLIIDFAVVKGLANTPLFGTIAISVGQPFLSILIYVIIKLIVMGIFFGYCKRTI